MSLSVHLLRPPPPDALAHLQAKLHPEVEITHGADIPAPGDCRILVAGRPSREQLRACAELVALIIPWAGLPEVTRDLMRDFPQVAVHNLHHNAIAVAELALALLLAAAKVIIPADRALRAHDWRLRYRREPSLLLSGKTALVLGYGAVGRQVARLCRGLGMKVIATRQNSGMGKDSFAEIHPPAALRSLLPRADLLFVCLPHTPETDKLIGAEELAALPPRAILVNVGRGPIVDEAALFHALEDGTLFAAGLDVWYNYPSDEAARASTPPSAYPFHELANVVMSPHRAGHSDETEFLRMTHLADLLNAAAEGRPMPNRVDLAAGY